MGQFFHETVFDRLLRNGVEWAIYAGDFALAVMTARQLRGKDEYKRTFSYEDFRPHVEEGRLPAFTWIEPQYLEKDGKPPNDMHPPHNVLYAQELVADVYNALRSNEDIWSKCLFMVTCDEGVGVFDHVPPPTAPDPAPNFGRWHRYVGQEAPETMSRNPFKMYGTRVPCLIASPFVEKGAVVRPVGADDSGIPYGEEQKEPLPFDHTSIMRTLFDLFVGTECHLAQRDKVAPSLAPALDGPRIATTSGQKTCGFPKIHLRSHRTPAPTGAIAIR